MIWAVEEATIVHGLASGRMDDGVGRWVGVEYMWARMVEPWGTAKKGKERCRREFVGTGRTEGGTDD